VCGEGGISKTAVSRVQFRNQYAREDNAVRAEVRARGWLLSQRRDNFEFADKYVRARVSTGRLCYGGFRKPNARLLAMLVGEFKRQGFR
jgi:hypothetical protein